LNQAVPNVDHEGKRSSFVWETLV